MKRVIGVALTILLILIVGHAHAEPINVAPSGTVTASGSYLDQTPDKAIDEHLLTYWNSGDFPTHWIEVDLGGAVQIGGIRAHITQLPDGHTHHDVYLDGVLSFSWEGLTVDQQVLSHFFHTPITVKTVRVETTASPSWVGWREVQIMTPGSEPTPATTPIPTLSEWALLILILAVALIGLEYVRTTRSV